MTPINTMVEQNGRDYADDIVKYNLLKSYICILIKSSSGVQAHYSQPRMYRVHQVRCMCRGHSSIFHTGLSFFKLI